MNKKDLLLLLSTCFNLFTVCMESEINPCKELLTNTCKEKTVTVICDELIKLSNQSPENVHFFNSLNANLEHMQDAYCHVIAEKLQTRKGLEEFIENKKINDLTDELKKLIAAKIVISKNDLCISYDTTLKTANSHRKLFNFPSKLSLLEFPNFNENKKLVVLLMPTLHAEFGYRKPVLNGPINYNDDKIDSWYCYPNPDNLTIRDSHDNPLLIIKNTKNLLLSTDSSCCYKKPCPKDTSLTDIFESNEWLLNINENDKPLELLNSQLTLEEKLCICMERIYNKELNKLKQKLDKSKQKLDESKQKGDRLGKEIKFIYVATFFIVFTIGTLYLASPKQFCNIYNAIMNNYLPLTYIKNFFISSSHV